MKTIKYYLDNLNKSSENEVWINLEDICLELGFPGYYFEQEISSLKCYWGLKWLCTDTMVGLKFYFLDNELICVSYQRGRKCNEEFEWVSSEAKNTLRKILINLILKKLEEENVIIVDFNQEIDEN